jgi:hypothetical protein
MAAGYGIKRGRKASNAESDQLVSRAKGGHPESVNSRSVSQRHAPARSDAATFGYRLQFSHKLDSSLRLSICKRHDA